MSSFYYRTVLHEFELAYKALVRARVMDRAIFYDDTDPFHGNESLSVYLAKRELARLQTSYPDAWHEYAMSCGEWQPDFTDDHR